MLWSKNVDYHSDSFSLVAGVVLGAVLVGLVWMFVSGLTPSGGSGPTATLPAPSRSGDGASAGGDASRTSTSPGPSDGDPTDQATYLERCREVYDAENHPLRALRPSLAQWQVHIAAMNKLVAGAISYQQALQFWNRTRVGAHAKLDDFAAAHELYDQRTVRCPQPWPSSDLDSASRECQQAVEARARAIRTATIALATWRMHVHHMEMLRRGEMSPEEATQLWLQNWRQGIAEVHEYNVAARRAAGETC